MGILKQPRFACVSWAIVVTLVSAARLSAQPPAVVEDDVKAAFLFNFAKFVEWPDAAFPTGALRVCVAAEPAFVDRVDGSIAGETIGGHPVTRLTPSTREEMRSCNILFLGRAGVSSVDQQLAAVRGAPVLTVGDTPDFLSRGGMVAFVRDRDRVRFDVNVDQAQRAGLTISSRLLRVARRVTPSGSDR